jgi:hypothetical protein
MKRMNMWGISFGGLTMLLLAAAGCGGVDDAADGSAASDSSEISWGSRAWWRKHHAVSNTGGTTASGGSAATGGVEASGGTVARPTAPTVSAGCAVCTKAQACCNESSGGDALCAFDAGTCAALEPTAQQAYVTNCLTLIDTVKSARSAVPSSCQ